MVGKLDGFRMIGAADTNSFVKLDTKKSKEGAPVYKEFGAGKSGLGRIARNTRIISTIYSFAKDPSASENKRVKKEFIALFGEAYPQFKGRLEELVKPNSKQPLRAHIVHQLFAEADKIKPTAEFSYNGAVEVRNSHFRNEEHVTEVFEAFVGKANIHDENGGLLGLLSDPSGYIRKKYPEVMNVEAKDLESQDESQGGFGLLNENQIERHKERIISSRVDDLLGPELLQYNRIHDLKMMANRNSRLSAFVFQAVQNGGSGLRESKLDVFNLIMHTPMSAERHMPDELKNAIRGASTFKDIADLQMLLMERVQANDPAGVAKIGRDIVAAMRSMGDAIDAMVSLLLHPKVRDETINQAANRLRTANPGDRTEDLVRQATANVDELIRGLNAIRGAIQNPANGFHGILALGIVAAGDPQAAIEKLRRDQGQNIVVENGGEPVQLNVRELHPLVLDENDLEPGELERDIGNGIVDLVLNREPPPSKIGTDN